MRIRTPVTRIVTIVAVLVLGASCTNPGSSFPSQTVCDGISSDAGGCTAERHSFAATTCDGLAREWATVLDRQVVTIVNGPPDPGRAVSVRLKSAVSIVTIDLNTKLRALDLAADCDVPKFMDAAQPGFSADVRAKVGAGLYDGDPVATYEDWLADVKRTLAIIDDGESPPPT